MFAPSQLTALVTHLLAVLDTGITYKTRWKIKVERNGFTYLDQPLKVLFMYRIQKKKKHKRHFPIALNLISASCLANKNTYYGRIWGLNVPPKLEPQFYNSLGKGVLK